jgi:hypothetical protein
MQYRNWTLIIGCLAFISVGGIAIVFGASVTTGAFRAVVAAFVGGLLGFCMDYFAAQAPSGPSGRVASAPGPRSSERAPEE